MTHPVVVMIPPPPAASFSSAAHGRERFRKGFWRVGNNLLMPYLHGGIQRRTRCDSKRHTGSCYRKQMHIAKRICILIHVFDMFMYKLRKCCHPPQSECREQGYIDLGLCFLSQSPLRSCSAKHQSRSTGWQCARTEPYSSGVNNERVIILRVAVGRFPRAIV
jgi:hypothetical protein